MFRARTIPILLILSAWLLRAIFSVPLAATAPLEREPAFRDNLYDAEVRGSHAWIVGYFGTLLHSGDRGLTWELQRSGTQEALFRLAFIDEKQGWISGSYGTILHTRDGGKSWKAQSTPTQEHLFGLHFADERLGWAVGSRGAILITEDGGASWKDYSLGEDVILNDVWFKDARQGWIVGEFGRIYHSQDGGHTWRKQQSPVEVSFVSGESRNLFRLLFPDSQGGWVFGLDGVILRTGNGESWELHHPDGAGPLPALRHHLFSAALFDGKKWAVGERGTVLVAATGQDQWQAAKLKIPPLSLNGIAFGSDGLGLIVGSRGLILKTEDGGGEWRPIKIVPEAAGKGVSQAP
ncbi:MAG: hypothetical protein HYY46_07595 [Deltaproteobacteria bacterium]|nr:hypothetical protein [Deltaproteobacteria bacterium]